MGFTPEMQGWFNIYKSRSDSSILVDHRTEIILYVGKTFDKVQHPFIIKAFKTIGIEGTYFIIKAT